MKNFVIHLYAKPGASDPKLGNARTSMVHDEWNVGQIRIDNVSKLVDMRLAHQ